MAPEPLSLTILRHRETIAMDLTTEDPVVPRSHIPVEERFLTDLCEELARLAALATKSYALSTTVAPEIVGAPDGFLDALKGLGRLLFAHLFPEPVRERLACTLTTDLLLRLDDQLVHVPWELAFDGSDFLLARFRIGRQVLTRHSSVRRRERPKQGNAPLHMLIIADPTENLPAAAEEAERLCTLLDGHDNLEVSIIGGKQVRKIDLLRALNACDLVHYAGHAAFDAERPDRSSWILHDAVLTAAELSRLDHPPLLVFANACQAGVMTAWRSAPVYDGQTFGLGSAFLLAGARNYIGTFWVIHDALSATFAADFYGHLLLGQSVGAALLHARQKALQDAGWESLLWASYMHYGNPAFRLPLVTTQKTIAEDREPHIERLRSPQGDSSAKAPAGALQQEKQENEDGSPAPQRRKLLHALGGFVLLALLLGLGLWGSRYLGNGGIGKHVSDKRPLLTSRTSDLTAYQQAYADFFGGKINAALAVFKRLADTKDNPRGLGYDGLAAVYFEAGLTEKASRLAMQALHINPHHTMAHLLQGDIHYTRGEMDKALKAYHLAAGATPLLPWQQARAHNAIGVVDSLRGTPEQAIQHFTKAVSIDPDFYDAYDNLGYLAWRQNRVDEARTYFEQARALHPADAVAGFFLAEIASLTAHPGKPVQASSNDMPRLCILPLSLAGGNIKRLGEGATVAGLLAASVRNQGDFDVVELAALRRLLADQRIGFATLADSIAALNIGKLLKADVVVYGSALSFANTFSLDVRAVNVQTTELLTTAHLKTSGANRIRAAAHALGWQLIPLLPRGKMQK